MYWKYLVIFLLLNSAAVLSACSCNTYLLDLPIKEMGWLESESAGVAMPVDLIFTGVLLDSYEVVVEGEYKYELVFEQIRSYKGDSRDTLTIRTNYGSDACGFITPIGTASILFARKKPNGHYYTYRSDCCKSISQEAEPIRYEKYITFLESMLDGIDGAYHLTQSRSYWEGGYPDQADTMALLTYEISNGRLDGEWKVTDRRGRVLEEGQYASGEKVGSWKIVSYSSSDYEVSRTKTEQIEYVDGRPFRSLIVIEDRVFNFESGAYETVRTQREEVLQED